MVSKSNLLSSAGRAPAALAALGVISGVLTNLACLNIDAISPDTNQHSAIFNNVVTALITGVFFAAVVCFAIFASEKATKFKIATAFLISILAWRLAYGTATTVNDLLGSDLVSDGSLGFLRNIRMEISGLLGGFVGSLVTVSGVAFAGNVFRRLRPWAMTVLTGTVAGIVLGLEERLHLPWGYLALFVVWQAGVAASIGYGLADTKHNPA